MRDKKTSINVDMTGIEYMEYMKGRKFVFPKLSNKTKQSLPYFGVVFVGMIILSTLIYNLTYVPPEPINWGYSNFWGVTVHNGLVMWWSIAIGFAWMLHGFGFIIIRR